MKHIHFIGICGVGMSSLAILWKKKGWKVSGSDVGFYPPISTHLKKHNIEFYAGWHPERIGGCHVGPRIAVRGKLRETSPESRGILRCAQDDKKREWTTKPDLVVVGNVAGSENPEWKFVLENKIQYVSYPELIAQNLVKENSIVCAGTYGKTSTAALLAWILSNADYKPAYMFGGLSLDMEESADDPNGNSHPPATPLKWGLWSVLEGDEYKTSRWDNRAKFFSYKPTHLLLTSVEWDHADIYPTKQSYIEAFQKLVEMMPENGLIVISENARNVMLSGAKHPLNSRGSFPAWAGQDDNYKVITYGKNSAADYQYSNVQQTKNGLTFNIVNQNQTYKITAPIIGEYNAENICGAFAMAKEIGIAPERIISAIKNFHGLKRRLEKRGTINGADIFDDIAHSPAKAKSVLETLRRLYCHCEEAEGRRSNPMDSNEIAALPSVTRNDSKIYAIFEPNTGNRQQAAIPQYDNAFTAADTVIIPRLTKIKIKPGEKIIDGPELVEIISKTHGNVKYFENDNELINFIKQKTRPGDAVVFLGSHGFRGMIEQIMQSVKIKMQN